MDNNTITLTDGEVALAGVIGSMRSAMNRMSNIPNTTFGNFDIYSGDILGVCGEIAYGKRFNLYLDLTFNTRSGGHDFLSRQGKTVDIKTTPHGSGKLIVPMWKNEEEEKRSDIYVLVTGKIPTFKIRGWATADAVFNSIIDLGHGPCYGLDQNQLTQFS
jgi:hypothetical protein